MRHVLMLLAAALAQSALVGCMSVSNAPPDITASEGNMVVVMGLKSGQQVALMAGQFEGEKFKPNKEGFTAHIRSQDGYIVTQQPARSAGQGYAVTQFQLVKGGPVYGACNWVRALAFDSPGGKIIYLGDFEFSVEGDLIKVAFRNNLAAARAYMTVQYPKLRGAIEYQSPKFMEVPPRTDCDNRFVPIYMPIYLKK